MKTVAILYRGLLLALFFTYVAPNPTFLDLCKYALYGIVSLFLLGSGIWAIDIIFGEK